MAEFNNIRTYTHEEKVECRKAIEKAIKDLKVMNCRMSALHEEEIAEKEAHNLDVWKKKNDIE